MFSNLIASFQQIGNAEKVMELQTLRSVLMWILISLYKLIFL
jgi:hypothetical protein